MKRTLALLWLVGLGSVSQLEAHAFLQEAAPGVGSTVAHSPNEIRIKFTEAVEPAFSRIQVFGGSHNREVDKGDVHLDKSDHAALEVSVPSLAPGTYKVSWRVVSVDTHVTAGSFDFRVGR